MSLSMVIPTYTISKHIEDLAVAALASYREQVDELIVVEDGGLISPRYFELVDRYIYNTKNQGFSKNVNCGWKLATGDFVAIVNSDTTLVSGNLQDLCIPGKVTSPHITNQYIDFLAGPFWVAPKDVTVARGMLLEDMVIYSSDSDYDHRVRDIFMKVPSVKVYHEQAVTVKTAGVEGGIQQHRDRLMYARLCQEGKASA